MRGLIENLRGLRRPEIVVKKSHRDQPHKQHRCRPACMPAQQYHQCAGHYEYDGHCQQHLRQGNALGRHPARITREIGELVPARLEKQQAQQYTSGERRIARSKFTCVHMGLRVSGARTVSWIGKQRLAGGIQVVQRFEKHVNAVVIAPVRELREAQIFHNVFPAHTCRDRRLDPGLHVRQQF